VLLDRERCVQCARCTRFSEQIAGDPFIELLERGANQQVGIYPNEPLESYFSGNTVQICPVGALTGVAYRFRARPFDLISSPSVCEHCASGCAQRTDHRRGTVLRRLAGDDPTVNEEWNCDKGRWAFTYATQPDRVTTPLVRRYVGAGRGRSALVPASWSEALAAAAAGLAAHGSAGVLVGGRTTLEDAYGYAKFARVALGTNDIDFRARAHSREEAEFLAARVAGRPALTYADLDAAPAVLLVAFEPEEESPIVYLRLRKAVRTTGLEVYAIAPYATNGLRKMSGTLVQAAPGAEPRRLHDSADLLTRPGSVILVGERLAGVPGGFTAALRLAEETGSRLAWIPRRAGERGALEAGALPDLLPGGRPLDHPDARREVAAVWNTPDLPTVPGRDITAILAAADTRTALVIGGVEVDDLPDPRAALTAIDAGVRHQPRTAPQRGDRPRGCGVPRRRRCGEAGRLPELGGPRAAVRRRTAPHRGHRALRHARSASPQRDRRRNGPLARHSRRRGRPARTRPTRRVGRRTRRPARRRRRAAADTRCG